MFFHPECARKAHYNLALNFKEIYCRKHRKELRLEVIRLFTAVRSKEITDFALNLQACYQYVSEKDSVEARAKANFIKQR